mgnify:CR=1 FL=1
MARKKDRKLGTTSGKRVYDLPLHKNESTGFLVLLVALMSFLACISLTASFALDEMGKRWSSGLENKVTIEIPAEDEQGNVGSVGYVKDLTLKAVEALKGNSLVKQAEPLSDEEIQGLIAPWLGENLATQELPLPGLISVELYESKPETLQSLERSLKNAVPTARIDTHDSWLSDLLRFTSALKFAAFTIILIIGLTTVTAVAGAVGARMAVHRAEVELLHIMGAKDEYITRQFQRHALILAMQGSIAGVAGAAMIMGLLGLISGDAGNGLLPDFSISLMHIVFVLTVPAVIAGIATLTARATVLRDLARMP